MGEDEDCGHSHKKIFLPIQLISMKIVLYRPLTVFITW